MADHPATSHPATSPGAAGTAPTPPVRPAGPGARLDRLPFSRWHRRLIAVVATAAFFDLYELFLGGVLGATLKRQWHLDTTATALVVASAFIGMFFGAIVLGAAADRYGRRRMFLVNLGWYSLLSAAAAAAPDLTTVVVARILGGLALGAELTLVGNYLGEFMPPRHRGRAMAWMFVIGFAAIPVAAFLGGRFVATGHVLIDGWRWLLLVGALGALGALIIRRRLPESPRWLISRGREEEAERVVAGIEDAVRHERGQPLPPIPPPPDLAWAEGDGIVPAAVEFRDTLRGRYRRRTVMLWIFHVLQTVGYYGFGSIAPLVLLAKGFSIVDSLGYVGLSFLGYPIGAAVAMPLIERCERRTLIIVSAGAMAGFGLVFGFATAPGLVVTAGFCLSVASNVFATGFYTYQAELFPPSVSGTAVGIAYSLSRAVAAALPFAALPLLAHLGPAAVYLCSAAVLLVVCLDVGLGPRSTGQPLDTATAGRDRGLTTPTLR